MRTAIVLLTVPDDAIEAVARLGEAAAPLVELARFVLARDK